MPGVQWGGLPRVVTGCDWRPCGRAFGELQEKVISRLMDLLLSAIAVQMLVSGLRGWFPVLA